MIDELYDKMLKEGITCKLYSAYDVDDISMNTFLSMKDTTSFITDDNQSIYKYNKDWIIIKNDKDTYSLIYLHKVKWIMKSKSIITGKYSIFIAKQLLQVLQHTRVAWQLGKTSIFKFTFKANTIMGKVSKETRREQRYNANLHNLFVKAQEEIANEQYG